MMAVATARPPLIRWGTAEDLELLAPIMAEAHRRFALPYSAPMSLELLRTFLPWPQTLLLIVQEGSRIGYVWAEVGLLVLYVHQVYLPHLPTAPVEAMLFQTAQRYGCKYIIGVVHRPAAVRLFRRRYGAIPVGTMLVKEVSS